MDKYIRGDFSIAKPHVARDIQFTDFPVNLEIQYVEESTGTQALVNWIASEKIEFDNSYIQFFYSNARTATDSWGKAILEATESLRSENASAENESEPNEVDDDEHDCDVSIEATHLALVQLGLDRRATWADVQSAYRQICKLYHPDANAANEVPAHFRHLGEEKFKKATSAYQLLRQVFQNIE